jgi:hypothetical protein
MYSEKNRSAGGWRRRDRERELEPNDLRRRPHALAAAPPRRNPALTQRHVILLPSDQRGDHDRLLALVVDEKAHALALWYIGGEARLGEVQVVFIWVGHERCRLAWLDHATEEGHRAIEWGLGRRCRRELGDLVPPSAELVELFTGR